MNKEDLKIAREKYDAEQTAIMMKAINDNHQRAYDKLLLERYVKNITKAKEEKRRVRYDILSIIVIILMAVLLIAMFVFSIKNYNDVANECDAEKGYICSDYEVRQYAIRGE